MRAAMADRLEAIAGWVVGDASPAVGRRGSGWGARQRGPVRPYGRGTASGAVALIEVEVGDGLRLGRVVHGRLVDVEGRVGVEAEVVLGRTACE